MGGGGRGSGPSGISTTTILFQGSRGGLTFSKGGPISTRGGGSCTIAYSLQKPIYFVIFLFPPSGSANEDTWIRGLK